MLSVRELTSSIYDHCLSGEWYTLAEELTEYFGTAFVAIALFLKAEDGSHKRGAIISQDHNLAFSSVLDQYSNLKNPFIYHAYRDELPSMSTLWALPSAGSVMHENFCAMLKSFNFGDVARCTILETRSHRVVLNIYREYEQKAWSETEMAELETIQFHLARAAEIGSRTKAATDVFSQLIKLARENSPFIVLDEKHGVRVRFNWRVNGSKEEFELPPFIRRRVRAGNIARAIPHHSIREFKKCGITFQPLKMDKDRKLVIGPMECDQNNLYLLTRDRMEDDNEISFLEGISQLSDRESSCFELLTLGKSEADISDALSISKNTIKFHRKNIYQKLDIASGRELIVLAQRFL